MTDKEDLEIADVYSVFWDPVLWYVIIFSRDARDAKIDRQHIIIYSGFDPGLSLVLKHHVQNDLAAFMINAEEGWADRTLS